jgi:hypothetical protein
MLPLKTRKEIKQMIWDEMCQQPDLMTGVTGIGVTDAADRKWSVFITAPEAPFRDEALRRAEIISERLMQDFDLAELVPLTMEINVKPDAGYRMRTLRNLADVDDLEKWMRLGRTPTNSWLIVRRVIDAAKARPTEEATRAATTYARAALRSDGNLAS